MPDETDKKLDYLKREEVRTMGKDVARLRELESETTREKIAEIKTGEEAIRETERLRQFKVASEERERLEAEAKRREKVTPVAPPAPEKAVTAENEEREKERLRAQLRGAQLREEEERKKFLEKVSIEPPPISFRPVVPPPPIREKPPVPPSPADLPAEASPPIPPEIPTIPKKEIPSEPIFETQKPIYVPPEIPPTVTEPPAIPTKKPFKVSLPSLKIPKLPPLRLPKIQLPKVQIPKVKLPKVQLPKVAGFFPKKPPIFEKIWVRAIISLFILAILTIIVTFWYWYLIVRPNWG